MKRTMLNFWLNFLSFWVMVSLALTGGLLHFVLPPRTNRFLQLFGWRRHDYGNVHFYLAVLSVLLLVIHIILHWNWVCSVTVKMFAKDRPNQRSQIVGGLVFLCFIFILLTFGLWYASTKVTQKNFYESDKRIDFSIEGLVINTQKKNCYPI